jgi:hypothetical protein
MHRSVIAGRWIATTTALWPSMATTMTARVERPQDGGSLPDPFLGDGRLPAA